jgi:hypothetical protein
MGGDQPKNTATEGIRRFISGLVVPDITRIRKFARVYTKLVEGKIDGVIQARGTVPDLRVTLWTEYHQLILAQVR